MMGYASLFVTMRHIVAESECQMLIENTTFASLKTCGYGLVICVSTYVGGRRVLTMHARDN